MKKLLLFLFLLFILFYISFSRSFASVPINNYIQFQGGHLKAINNSTATPSSVTFELWVKPDNISGIKPIISIGKSNSQKFNYEIGINGGSFYLNYTHGINSYRYITAGQIEANVWSHMAVVISEVSTKMYINGQQIYTTNGSTNLPSIGDVITLGINYQLLPFSSEKYKGDIDELRISTTTRDIVGNWNTGVYDSALINDNQTLILWHFDEIRGQLITSDSSGNNIIGVLIGGDSKIHFFGVLPTPTKFVLPTLKPIDWPYISRRPTQIQINPTSFPTPTSNFSRYDRPIFPR